MGCRGDIDLLDEAGIPGLRISLNVSAAQIRRPEDVERLLSAVNGLDTHNTTIELTESAIIDDAEGAGDFLKALSALGCRVALDDFGTGFSSLVNLRNLPVDELKIDRSFVTEMMVKHDDDVIVRSTIDLAHNLGLQVVAEGVETGEVLNRLAELQCDIAQGFGISRPIPRAMFEAWLADRGETSTEMGETNTSFANHHQ